MKKNGGEFDQFTGATITPAAVVNAVEQTLVYFREHREAIITAAGANSAMTNDEPQPDKAEG